MAGLEPARANYSPTDFKSVASTIPPHRRCGVDSKLLPRFAKMHFAVRTDSDAVERVLVLSFRNPLKDPQLTQSLIDVPKEKIEISPWRKSAKLQRKGQPPNVRSGKSLPNRRSNRLRRFSFGSKERCLHLAGSKDTGMSADEGLALFTPADLQDPKYSYLFLQTPPPGTTGLGRRLDPEKYYFACRWNYNDTPREFLKRALARVENPANGRAADARPVDWGPNISTGRVADLSPGLAEALGLQTDDVVRITISALRAIPVKPAKRVKANCSGQSTCAARQTRHQTVRPQPELFFPQGRNKDRQDCFTLH